MQDPHEVLGVPPDATVKQIRKAYKKLARRYHPDHNPDQGAARRFIAVKAAHDELLREREKPAPSPPPAPAPPPEPYWMEEEPLQLRDLRRPALYAGGALVWVVVFWISLYGMRQAAEALGPRPPVPRPPIAAEK